VTVGINVREYSRCSAWALARDADDVASDYATIATTLRGRGLLPAPVIVSGVSEGAAWRCSRAPRRQPSWIAA
jgi:hypothetical protein